MLIKKVRIERTRKGHPALWEQGGGFRNTGEATIVANPDGSPKIPVYVRQRGHLACSNHALFVVSVGDIVIKTDHHRRDFNTYVYKITAITEEEAELQLIDSYQQGEWNDENIERVFSAWEAGDLESIKDIDDETYNLCRAILAAHEKATCYHCREPHYIDE